MAFCKNCAVLGSPPHGRGKVLDLIEQAEHERITPAWAGKSLFCFTAAVPIQDHPRVGGEKLLPSDTLFLELGSPPRRRGKAEPERLRKLSGGITPAWAGKSPAGRAAGPALQDHPRVGGEKFAPLLYHTSEGGSPPRRRGKVVGHSGVLLDVGITHAWAGKRLTRPAMTGTPKDHPRMGGEKVFVMGSVAAL